MKKIYIGTLMPTETGETPEGYPKGAPIPGLTTEQVILAENMSEVEAIVGDKYTIERLVNIENWILMSNVEEAKGTFYMADARFHDEETGEMDSIQFFVRAESIQEIEDIVSAECGETFRFILSVEKAPYVVLGLED